MLNGLVALHQLSGNHELKWLDERSDGTPTFGGYNTSGWEDTIWILHAMYETQELSSGVTYHEAAQQSLRPDVSQAVDVGGCNAVLVGCPRGGSRAPGPGWHRLRWRTLAQRQDLDLFADQVPPCFRTFLYQSWPLAIRPPSEGSLDWEQLVRLTEHLADHTDGGLSGRCLAYYSIMVTIQDHPVHTGTMQDILDAYEDELLFGSPNNFWPEARNWVVWSDYDLWATRVDGPSDLIRALEADETLETERMEPLFGRPPNPIRVTRDGLMRLKD